MDRSILSGWASVVAKRSEGWSHQSGKMGQKEAKGRQGCEWPELAKFIANMFFSLAWGPPTFCWRPPEPGHWYTILARNVFVMVC